METLVKSLFRNISIIFFVDNFFQLSTPFAKIIPLEEWAKRADVRNVTLSPNGEKLALLRIMTTEGMPHA